MRPAVLLLALLVLGCSRSSSAEPPPVEPAAPPVAPPVTSAPPPEGGGAPPGPATTCVLELAEGDAWTERARVPCPPSGAVRFLLAADVGLPTRQLAWTVQGAAAVCAAKGCDLGLLAGDLLYDDGRRAEEYWRAIWDGGFALLGFPFAAVLGNHEWRHEPNPHLKREAVFGADGRAGLVAPGPSYALRLRDEGGAVLVAIAGVDTDSVSVPLSPPPKPKTMPGLGDAALAAACGTGAPVVWLGHHPPSSQGLHHTHEANVEAALRQRLVDLGVGGCDVAVAVAGHDHDLQAYGPGCEQEGAPGVLVAGPSARGFRPEGPRHLTPCPAAPEAVSTAHFGPKATGGFAWFSVTRGPPGGTLEVDLIETTEQGALTLSSHRWAF